MPRTEVYKDKADEWRWRRFADNGNIIADSGESYKNKNDAVEMAARNFPDDEVGIVRDSIITDQKIEPKQVG